MNQSMSVMPLRDLYPRMIIQTSEHFSSAFYLYKISILNICTLSISIYKRRTCNKICHVYEYSTITRNIPYNKIAIFFLKK